MDDRTFELYQQLTPDRRQLVDDTISFMLEHPDATDTCFRKLFAGEFSAERAREVLQKYEGGTTHENQG